MTTFLLLIVIINVGAFFLRVFLAVKHPAAYEALEREETKRRDKNRNNMLGAAKFGIQAYKFLRR